MEFKINDLQGIIGAQNISRKILKITRRYYLTVKLDAALLMYFFVCFWSALCLLKNVFFYYFFANVYHIVFKS